MSEALVQTEGDAEQRALYYNSVLGMLTNALMAESDNRSKLPPTKDLQTLAAGMQLDHEAIKIMVAQGGPLAPANEIIVGLNSMGMRDIGQTYATATRQAVDTVDRGRNETFLDLPNATRKEVYDELTTQMLAGQSLDTDEYNLIGWALGNEKGSAKPTVSSNGANFTAFIQQLNKNNPEAAKATTSGSIDALREIPMTTWAEKAIIGGILPPLVIAGGYVGAVRLATLIPAGYNAANVAMGSNMLIPSATVRVAGTFTTLLGAATRPLINRGMDAYTASMIYMRSLITGQSVSATINQMMFDKLNTPPSALSGAANRFANTTLGNYAVKAGEKLAAGFKAVTYATAMSGVLGLAEEADRNLTDPEAGIQSDKEAEQIRDDQLAAVYGEETEIPNPWSNVDQDLWEGIDQEIEQELVTAGFTPPPSSSSPVPQQTGAALPGRPDRLQFNFAGGPAALGDASPISLEQDGRVVRDEFGKPISFEITADTNIAEIEAYFTRVDNEQDQLEDPFLGVPAGHFATITDQERDYDDARWEGPGRGGNVFEKERQRAVDVATSDKTFGVPSQYRVSNVTGTLFSLTPAQLEYFQRTAERAGLIDEGDPAFLYGSVDQSTIDAMSITMAHANNTGRTWRTQVSILATNWQKQLEELKEEQEEPIKPLFVPPAPYIKMDPETVTQKIEADIERRLGRSANDWEMSEIARYMESNHRANYDEQIVGEKALFEARGRAEMGEDPGPLPVLQEIDEEAQYQAKFEERYETELDETDRWERQKRDTANLFRSFDVISKQMGGV